jgi:KDO2-lipid IV(A) lauroyltransferase
MTNSRKITWQYRLEYYALIWVKRILSTLPLSRRHKIARWLGLLAYYLVPIRRQVLLQNLTNAIGFYNPGSLHRMARRSYVHFAKMFLDFFPTHDSGKPDRFPEINVIGRKQLDQALALGKGVVLIGFHIGNWELLVEWLIRMDYPVGAIARRLRNPLAEQLIYQARVVRGLEIFPFNTPAENILKFLRSGKLLIALADQDARKHGVFVNFCNQWAASFRGPAVFTLRQNCPLILASCLLEPRGVYTIRFNTLELSQLPPDQANSVVWIIQQYTKYFEALIRCYPEQYFWFHRRWKTQPQKKEIQ